MISINNYWINFSYWFSILTIGVSLYGSIDETYEGFVPVRIVMSLIYAYLVPIFKAK